MLDPNFHQTVTYICEHSDSGALGIVINRPMNMDISEVLMQLSLEPCKKDHLHQPVLQGGPVQSERGFVLHESSHNWDSTTEVSHSIYVTTSQDILSDVAAGPAWINVARVAQMAPCGYASACPAVQMWYVPAAVKLTLYLR